MGKRIPDPIYDLMLAEVGDPTTTIHVCRAEPTSYAELANSTGDGTGGGFTLVSNTIGSPTPGPGPTTGRQTEFPATTGGNVVDNATANHVALSNGVDTLLLVTTCTSQPLSSGGVVDTTAFAYVLPDPI